jgi:malate synthase
MYLFYKKKYFSTEWLKKNIKQDHDINSKDLYKGLPQIEKEFEKRERQQKLEKRQERNQSLPSLYLEASRAIGKKNLEKV